MPRLSIFFCCWILFAMIQPQLWLHAQISSQICVFLHFLLDSSTLNSNVRPLATTDVAKKMFHTPSPFCHVKSYLFMHNYIMIILLLLRLGRFSFVQVVSSLFFCAIAQCLLLKMSHWPGSRSSVSLKFNGPLCSALVLASYFSHLTQRQQKYRAQYLLIKMRAELLKVDFEIKS